MHFMLFCVVVHCMNHLVAFEINIYLSLTSLLYSVQNTALRLITHIDKIASFLWELQYLPVLEKWPLKRYVYVCAYSELVCLHLTWPLRQLLSVRLSSSRHHQSSVLTWSLTSCQKLCINALRRYRHCI